MHTFRTLDRQIGMVPAPVAVALGGIDRAQGRKGALRERGPETLSTLREIARIQSVESSNAIEDITAPGERIRELVSREARPENRPEEEIAGYRAVLDTITPTPRVSRSPQASSSSCTATCTSSRTRPPAAGRRWRTRSRR